MVTRRKPGGLERQESAAGAHRGTPPPLAVAMWRGRWLARAAARATRWQRTGSCATSRAGASPPSLTLA
eukprot:180951-Prymnesium_polylepis.1